MNCMLWLRDCDGPPRKLRPLNVGALKFDGSAFTEKLTLNLCPTPTVCGARTDILAFCAMAATDITSIRAKHSALVVIFWSVFVLRMFITFYVKVF